MNFTKLKTGDILEIKGKKYEIIWKGKSVSYSPEQGYKDIIEFNLLEEGSKRITPTHGMSYYLDTKEVSFSGGKINSNEIQLILG